MPGLDARDWGCMAGSMVGTMAWIGVWLASKRRHVQSASADARRFIQRGKPMKKILSVFLLGTTTAASAADWIPMSADETTRVFLDVSSLVRVAPDEIRFDVKRVYTHRRDMMGLAYDASLKTVVLACTSRLVLSQQQFLLDGDEVVWTFPESNKREQASPELPLALVAKVCP